MRLTTVCFVLLLGLVDRCLSTYFEEEDGVLILNESNFDEALREFPELFVEFYSPRCGACVQVAPIFADTARALKESKSSTRLAKIDLTVHEVFLSRFEIPFYPTFKLFLRGLSEPLDHDSDKRTVSSFLQWLARRTGFPAETVTDVQTAKQLIYKNTRVAFGFFKDQKSAAAKSFLQLASRNDDYVFAIVPSANRDVFHEFRAAMDSVVVFKQYDEGRADLKNDLDTSHMERFLKSHQFRSVSDYDDGISRQMINKKAPFKHFLLLFVDSKSKEFLKTVDVMRPVANAFRGDILVGYVDISDEINHFFMEKYGISVSDCPAVMLIDSDEKKKYKYVVDSEDASTSLNWLSLQQFVKNFQSGILKPFLKAQPLPSDWNSKPVKVLVSSNFQEVALDSRKNVFVEFYAPWCGYCQQLAPIWDQLAEYFKDVPDLIIAKIDIVANELAEYSINSLPTLKYFPRHGGPVVDYTGNRTLSDLIAFVANGGKVVEPPVTTETKIEEKKTEL